MYQNLKLVKSVCWDIYMSMNRWVWVHEYEYMSMNIWVWVYEYEYMSMSMWVWVYEYEDRDIMVQPGSLAARNYSSLQKLFGHLPEFVKYICKMVYFIQFFHSLNVWGKLISMHFLLKFWIFSLKNVYFSQKFLGK